MRLRLRATTLNNLGCMERRRGNLEKALEHTLGAANLEGNGSAATSLNVSAILTQLGRHSDIEGMAPKRAGSGVVTPLLVIAFHNLGMAQEPAWGER
eukprot:gene3561-48026_t